MKTLKTALSVILVLCMVLSIGGAAFAEDNERYLNGNFDTIENNNGYIANNYDTVEVNCPVDPGAVQYIDGAGGHTNWVDGGVIEVNSSEGEVGINNGRIDYNSGTVENNNDGGTVENNNDGGTVVNNNDGGTVKNNSGTVENNNDGGTVGFNDGGTVTNNNAGGTVTNNNGTIGLVDESGNPVEGTGNYGEIGINSKGGTVTSNNAGGFINTNAGTLISNEKGATVNCNIASGTIENNAGTVDTNIGTVETNTGTIGFSTPNSVVTDNYGEVTLISAKVVNNYGDVTLGNSFSIVENNYGGTITETSFSSASNQVTNDFFGVKVQSNDEIAGHTGSVGFIGNGYYLEREKTTSGFGSANGEITIQVTPKENYTLDEPTVDNAGNTDELSVSADGTGWIVSFKNLIGNILLTITGKKNEPEPQPDPQPQPDPKPEPKPEPKPAPVSITVDYASVMFTFDLDGGSLDGETGEVIKWYIPGATVKLPAAPTKDGCSFAGWETKVNGEKKVFEAGEKFTVTGAQSFAALWEEA